MLGRPDREHPPSRRRDAITYGAALLGHVALLALAFGVHRGAPPAPPPPDDLDESKLIELWSWAPAPQREVPPPAPPSTSPEAAAPRDLPGAAREALPDLPPPARPEVTPAPQPPGTSGPVASGEFEGPAPAVPMPGGGLSIGTPVWAVPGALPGGAGGPGGADTGAAPGPLAPRVPQVPGKLVLRDTMLSRDRELGLGNPGATAVANAVADAVRGSNVPAETSAVLVARIGGDGVVVSLGVKQFSSGDVKTWNRVAQAATAALGKRKLGLAGLGPRGAVVQVSVRSAVTLPSGAKSAARGILPSLTEGPPRDVMPAPSPDGDSCAPERWSDVKPLCGVGAKVGGFDVADMVAGKHRSVKTSFSITLLGDALALAAPAAPSMPASASPAPGSAAPAAPAPPPVAADAGAP